VPYSYTNNPTWQNPPEGWLPVKPPKLI